MNGFGGVLSTLVKGNSSLAVKIVDALKLFSLAPSLGGIESLVSQPSLTSQRDISQELRNKQGIKDNLIRISIGLEDPEDLENDLLQALDQC